MDVQLMPVPMPSTSKDESIVRNQAGALDKAVGHILGLIKSGS